MAEIVGLASGIIAIAGAAKTALNMAKSMRRLSRDLGAAKEDIRKFSKDIEAFSSIIGAAHFSLETHSKGPLLQSKVLVFIHKRKLLDQLVDQSDRVIDHIEEIRPRIKALKSRISFVTRLKWILRRTDIVALGPKMESVKTSLNLVMTLVAFETLMQSIKNQVGSQDSTKGVVREMRRLKRDMKRFLEEMVELQDQQRSSLKILEVSKHTFVDVQMDIRAALVELRESIVNNDTIPGVEHSSTSPGTLGTNNDLREVPIAIEHSRTSTVSTSRQLRHRRSPIRSQILRPTIDRAPPLAYTETIIYEDTDRGLPGEESEESGSLDLRQMPTETTDLGEGPIALTAEDHPESPLSTSGPSAEGDFISVHPTTYHLEFNSSLSHSLDSIKGYINTTNGWKSATALLDTELPQNLISHAYAKEVGLEIQLPDETQEAFWIRVDNRQERKSTGFIAVEWSQGSILDDRAFRVPCLVYDCDEIKTIVFGAPFLNKRKHYLQRASIATEAKEGR